MEYDKAKHILQELIKMDNRNEMTVRFLKKCSRQKKPAYLKSTRAISVFLFLLTAGIIALELCLIRPFFSAYIDLIEIVRNMAFAAGWIILIAGDLFFRWGVNSSVNKFVVSEKKKKKDRPVKEMV